MENRKMVFTTTMEHVAGLMKDQLEAAGINTLILNQRDSTYGTFGTIELYVLNEDAEKAKQIVEANQEEQ
ncbi:MAG: DUF2007 domain-containing protein [Crocinitomicaceae bacterium]